MTPIMDSLMYYLFWVVLAITLDRLIVYTLTRLKERYGPQEGENP